MRTTLLLASMGLLAAAEQPKTPAPLKTAERLALSDLSAKRAELDKQIEAILTEACADRGIPKERCRIQPDGSFVALPEPPKAEVKK